MKSAIDFTNYLRDELGKFRLLERRLSAVLSTQGISVDSWQVLSSLRESTNLSMKEVLDTTTLPPASATRAVDSLVSSDLAFRRPGEIDRRSVVVFITEGGILKLGAIDDLLKSEFFQSAL